MSERKLSWLARRMLARCGLLDVGYAVESLPRYLASRPHDTSYRFFRNFDGQPGLFVDIGANRGQSAVSFRIHNRSYRIVSYEPNSTLRLHLRRVAQIIAGPFEFHAWGFADAAGTRTLYVPTVDGVVLTQGRASTVSGS